MHIWLGHCRLLEYANDASKMVLICTVACAHMLRKSYDGYDWNYLPNSETANQNHNEEHLQGCAINDIVMHIKAFSWKQDFLSKPVSSTRYLQVLSGVLLGITNHRTRKEFATSTAPRPEASDTGLKYSSRRYLAAKAVLELTALEDLTAQGSRP